MKRFTAITKNHAHSALRGLTMMVAVIMFVLPTKSKAQDWRATTPYLCGFEDQQENAAWVLLNGDSTVANKWYIDTAVASCGGQGGSASCGKSLYVSDMGGISYGYDNSIASRVIAYREFAFGEGSYVVSFDWRGVGEGDCDMLIAALVPEGDSTLLLGGAELPRGVSAWSLPAGWIGLSGNGSHTGMWNATGWTRNERVVEIGAGQYAGGVSHYKLIFIWTNDYAEGSNPPAAVDNIAIREITCGTPTGLTATEDVFSVTLSWQAGGSEGQWIVGVDDTSTAWSEMTTLTPTVTVTGLQPERTYTFSVRAVCGEGDTSLAATVTATTGVTIPYYENFDSVAGSFPAGWRYSLTGDSAYATEEYAPRIVNGRLQMKGFGYVVLPKTDYETDTLQLTFTHGTPYSHSASGVAELVVGVMENGVFTAVDSIVDPQGGSFTKNVYFVGYEGTGGNIAFRNISNDAEEHYAVHYIDDVRLKLLPSCFPVADARATADSSSVEVSWSALFNSTTWRVTLTEASGAEERDTVTTSSPVRFDGLEGNTEYRYVIRTVCGEGDTSEASVGRIRTMCASIAHADLPYSYGFEDEDGEGLCWRGYGSSTAYVPGMAYGAGHSGVGYYSMNSSASEESYVVLPLFQDSPSTLMVSLWMRPGSSNGVARLTVGVMENETDTSSFTAVETIECSGSEMEFFEVPLTGYTGTGRNIALFCRGAGNHVCIDDVTVETTPTCSRVRSLEVPVVTAGAAMLQWGTGRIGSYQGAEVEVRDTMSDTWTTYMANGTDYLLTNLGHNTGYEARVRAVCENNETSQWVNARFTTAMTTCNVIDSTTFTTDTIGSGTGSNHFEFPVHNWHNYSFTEQLFTAREIDTAGSMSAIEFYYASDTLPMTAKDSCMIYMGVTSLETLSSTEFVHPSEMTLVYSGALNCTQGWNRFAFNRGFFNYDGRHNLVIAVVDNSGAAHNQNYRFACHSASGKAISFSSDEERFENYLLMQRQEYPYRNNIVLHMAECSAESECYPPLVFVDSIGASSVAFRVIPGGYETSWEVYYKTMGDEAFDHQGSTTQYSHTVSGLEPSTTYIFRIVGGCEDSAYSDFTITTKCLAQPLPYSEDFASWPTGASPTVPSCWYKESSLGVGLPYIYPWDVTGRQSVLYLYSNEGNYSYVAMPEMEGAIDSLQVTFWILREPNSSNAVTGNHPVVVGVMTDVDDLTTFHPIDTVAAVQTGVWEEVELPLDALATDTTLSAEQLEALRHGHITFLSPESLYSRPFIDEISVDYIPRCPHPSPVTVDQSLSTPDSVYLRWEGSNNAGYILTITSDDDTIAEFVTTDHCLVGGLNASMLYTASVRGICNEWSDGGTLLGSDTSVAITTDFRTPCGKIKHSPWREGFELNSIGGLFNAGFARCWDRIVDSCDYFGIPYVSNDALYGDVRRGLRGLAWKSSPGYLYGDYQFIVSPEIDTAALHINQLELSFWARAYSGTQRPTFIIGVMDNGDSTGWTFSAVDTVVIAGTTSWTKHTLYFDSYSGNGTHIAIKAERPESEWEAGIDDIEIRLAPLCPPVTDIVATALDTNSLSIAWTDHSTASAWDLYYGPHGFEIANGNYIYCTSTSITITGLAASTQYDIYLRPICDDDAPFAMATFTTADPYFEIPFHCNFSNPDENAKWNFSNGQHPNAWVIGSALGNGDFNSLYISQDNGASNTYDCNVTGISYAYVNLVFPDTGIYNYRFDWHSNGQYDFDYLRVALAPISFAPQGGSHIPAGFGTSTLPVGWIPLDGGSQLYGDTSQWTTVESELHIASPGVYRLLFAWSDYYIAVGHQSPAAIDNVVVRRTSCLTPSDLSVIPFNDSIYLSWTPNGDESQWIVSYDSVSIMTYDSHLTITGLTPNTDYSVSARAFCIEGDTSLAISRLCHTTCDPVNIPYSEDFNSITNSTTAFTNVFPSCWAQQVTGTEGTRQPQIYYGSVNAHSGNYALFLGKIAYVSMPPLSVPLNQVELSFYHLVNSSEYAIQVGVMEGDLFIPIATYYDMEEAYTQHTLTFESYSGQSRIIAFHNINEGFVGSPNFIDDILIDFLPECMPVTDISAPVVSTDQIHLDWNSGATAQSWEIEYGPIGFVPGNGTTLSANSHPFVVNGLDTMVTYDFYLRSYCGDSSFSDWTGPVQFSTSYCDDASSFSNGPSSASSQYIPICSDYSYSLTEIVIDAAELANLGPISALAFYYNDSQPITVKNSVNIWLQPTTVSTFNSDNSIISLDTNLATLVYSGPMNCQMGWNFFNFNDTYVWDGVNNLMIVVDDNSGVDEIDPLSFDVAQCNGQKTISYRSMLNDIDPTNPSTGYILKSRFNARPLLQLISCGGASCHEPVGLAAYSVSHDSATVSWQGVSLTYEVSLKETSADQWNEPVTVTTASTNGTFTFSNLDEMTEYDFRVRQLCPSGIFSDWAVGSFITAMRPCLPPSSPTVTNVGYDCATLDWTSHNDQSVWLIRLSTAYDTLIVATLKPFTLTHLSQDISYSVAVADSCTNNGSLSDFSPAAAFTTSLCLPVSDVTVSDVTATSALVSWTGDSPSYTIEYGIGNFNAGTGTTIDVDAPPFILTGLTPDKDYTLYVRANCTQFAHSVWSHQAAFRTATLRSPNSDLLSSPTVSLYPNPAKHSTTLSIHGITGELSLTIVDMNGRIVKETTLLCNHDDCSKTIELRDLPPGAYFLRLSSDKTNYILKLVVN